MGSNIHMEKWNNWNGIYKSLLSKVLITLRNNIFRAETGVWRSNHKFYCHKTCSGELPLDRTIDWHREQVVGVL